MERSQQKCLLASVGGHLLLAAVFALGSAFAAFNKPALEVPNIRVIPSKLVDELLAGGGGNPNKPMTDEAPAPGGAPEPAASPTPPPPEPAVAPAPPPVSTSDPTPVTPPEPAPKPPEKPEPAPKPDKPTPVVKPEPTKPVISKKPEVKPTKPTDKPKPTPDPKATTDVKTPPKKPEIDIDLSKVVTRPNNAEAKKREREAADRKAREAAETAQRKAHEEWANQVKVRQEGLAASLQSATRQLGTGFASDKGVSIDVGGPGGVAYANYGAFVKKAYDNAWILSPSLGDGDTTAEVSVTVLKSGEILSARISRRSGNSPLDKSVETALARVRSLPPFPEGARDEQRTFTIRFNLKAKRSSG